MASVACPGAAALLAGTAEGQVRHCFLFIFLRKFFFTRCDFVVWAGLVGDDRSVVVGYSNGSAEVYDMKPGVLNDKTP